MAVETVPTIPRDELIARLRDPSLTIVNVLPRDAWQAKRIPGSISLPVSEIPSLALEVIPDREADVAVYCASET